ncbi:MAG: hypothetical protein U0Y08_15660 [Bacteroidia bacterium]
MNGNEVQQALFQRVKAQLPEHLSLPEELASLLGVSADSAYRRIRGEKMMDLNELVLVCSRFKISLDSLLAGSKNAYLFHGELVNEKNYSFRDWLLSITGQLQLMLQGPAPELIFQAKDLPVFHFFQIPELAAFKYFFWQKSFMQFSAYEKRKFSQDEADPEIMALGRNVYLAYKSIPCSEIWTADIIHSTLRQISLYRQSGVFRDEKEASIIYDALLELVGHLESEAESACKFVYGEKAKLNDARYSLYINEVFIGDNAIYLTNGKKPFVYLNHTGINYIGTTDEQFCAHIENSFNHIMRKSTIISGVGEKERLRFFNLLRHEINTARASS